MSLFRAAATVSALTLLSRITGLIREYLVASIYGASALTDAFFVAFRLPNLLRRMFAEGAFSQAFVPMLARSREEHGDQHTREMVDHIATALFWILLAISVLGVLLAPFLVWGMASGLARDPANFETAVVMTRWMFPYILFISLVALASGILNTWRKFAVPAFSPVLLNLCFISAALLLSPHFSPPIYALVAGVVLGGIAQLAIQIPALLRIGMLPRIRVNLLSALRDPATRQLLKRMGPALLAVSVAQISLVINTHLASRLTAGSVSWISYADRLMEFPTALLGVALGTVLLPSLSRAATQGDADRYSELLDWGLRLVLLLALPCMVGLAMMAEPLTALLFNYGQFGARDIAMTQSAVVGYSIGLLGLIAVKVLAPGFYARQDIRTPVKIALAVLVMTQLMNLITVPVFAHAGLALSISLGALLNAALLLTGLLRGGHYRPSSGWAGFFARVLAACLAMAALLGFSVGRFDWIGLHAQPMLRIISAAGLIIAAAAVYAICLLALGLRPADLLRRRDSASDKTDN